MSHEGDGGDKGKVIELKFPKKPAKPEAAEPPREPANQMEARTVELRLEMLKGAFRRVSSDLTPEELKAVQEALETLAQAIEPIEARVNQERKIEKRQQPVDLAERQRKEQLDLIYRELHRGLETVARIEYASYQAAQAALDKLNEEVLGWDKEALIDLGQEGQVRNSLLVRIARDMLARRGILRIRELAGRLVERVVCLRPAEPEGMRTDGTSEADFANDKHVGHFLALSEEVTEEDGLLHFRVSDRDKLKTKEGWR